jgi:hypothetical protein
MGQQWVEPQLLGELTDQGECFAGRPHYPGRTERPAIALIWSFTRTPVPLFA